MDASQNRERLRAVSPGRLIFGAMLVCVVVCTVALFARLRQPGLGLVLEVDHAAAVVRIVSLRGPDTGLPTPSELVSLSSPGGAPFAVGPSDFIEDPDFLDTYPEVTELFARQSRMNDLLRAPEVMVTVRTDDGSLSEHRLAPATPSLGEIPGAFWFQTMTACAAFLISIWVLVLRPRERAVRFFALMGAAIPVFTVTAAIYSTRELAMDGDTLRVLSSVNHAGANLFGVGLVALFLSYPVALVRPRAIWIVPAIVLPWLILDVTHLAPNQNWGSRAPILLEMLAALVLGAVQWRATRGDPRGRAGLRWLGVSVLAGSGLFVASVVGSSILGWFPPISQGYSFAFFLLMHASFALGLRRHRLFELDEWAYAILLWVVSGFAVVALDAFLIAVLDANRALSTGAVLLVCGFLYLPARNWLWSKAVSRRTMPEHELFEAVLQVTFATDEVERARRWRSLLVGLFDPVECVAADEPVERVTVAEEGIRLDISAVGTIPAYKIMYPWRGRGLFGPRHVRLANNLVRLMQHAETQREAFERGVRDERARIASDMHDDIGAELLASLYCEDLGSTRDAIRQAMGDMRSIVHELTHRRLALDDVLGEIRHETMQRFERANIAVDWPLSDHGRERVIGYRVYRHVTSIFRELTSNVIRHASATRARVRVQTRDGRLVATLADDGKGFDAARVRRGRGLDNLDRRATLLGGTIAFSREGDDTLSRLDLPLDLEDGDG